MAVREQTHSAMDSAVDSASTASVHHHHSQFVPTAHHPSQLHTLEGDSTTERPGVAWATHLRKNLPVAYTAVARAAARCPGVLLSEPATHTAPSAGGVKHSAQSTDCHGPVGTHSTQHTAHRHWTVATAWIRSTPTSPTWTPPGHHPSDHRFPLRCLNPSPPPAAQRRTAQQALFSFSMDRTSPHAPNPR